MKSTSTGKIRKVLSIVLSLLIAVQTPALAGELVADEDIAVNEVQTVEEGTAQEVISTEETSGDVAIEEEVPAETIFEEEVSVEVAEEGVIPEEITVEVISEEVAEEETLDGEIFLKRLQTIVLFPKTSSKKNTRKNISKPSQKRWRLKNWTLFLRTKRG